MTLPEGAVTLPGHWKGGFSSAAHRGHLPGLAPCPLAVISLPQRACPASSSSHSPWIGKEHFEGVYVVRRLDNRSLVLPVGNPEAGEVRALLPEGNPGTAKAA